MCYYLFRHPSCLFMVSDYLAWQFVAGPMWLLRLAFNLQIMLLRSFSVPIMLKSLFSYWHRDAASLKQGSIEGIFQAIAWNIISRLIGFIIRCVVLAIWLISASLFLAVSTAALMIFILWAVLSFAGLLYGVVLMFS